MQIRSQQRSALITGITGQDGSLLADLLLSRGYSVTGLRRKDSRSDWRVGELGLHQHPRFELIEHDITRLRDNIAVIESRRPDEIYNFISFSTVSDTIADPLRAGEVTGLGVVAILEAICQAKPDARFFQASSAEMFGEPRHSPQDENTEIRPASPYAAAKAYAHWMTEYYRYSCDLFAASGIFYNHESPLRGLEFVTRKITYGLARLAVSGGEPVRLGNLDAERDWGYAGEYVEAAYRMLQINTPETMVIASGHLRSVREFVSLTCSAMNIDIKWRGSGADEVGVDSETGKTLVLVDPKYYRAVTTRPLVGDSSKALKLLDWRPATGLSELCRVMANADLTRHRIS